MDENDSTSTRVKRLPVTLSPEEVARIFQYMDREFLLIARLLYGTGLRILEAMRLRVKDVDSTRNTIFVREAKGSKDRATARPGVYHADVNTTMIYTHVLKVGGGVISALDQM